MAYELVNNMAFFDPAFVSGNSRNDFDFSGACKSSSLLRPQAPVEDEFAVSKTKCCGEYPFRYVIYSIMIFLKLYRFHYSDQGGTRDCCGSSTYDTTTHCCTNNSVKSTGTC